MLTAMADALEHLDDTVLLVRKGLKIERVVLVLLKDECHAIRHPDATSKEAFSARGTAVPIEEQLFHARGHVLVQDEFECLFKECLSLMLVFCQRS